MTDLLLILIIPVFILAGYWAMSRLDTFLNRSFQREPPACPEKKPACLMLSDRIRDEELLQAIRQFTAQHPHTSIILRAEADREEADPAPGDNNA